MKNPIIKSLLLFMMFSGCKKLETVPRVILSDLHVFGGQIMTGMSLQDHKENVIEDGLLMSKSSNLDLNNYLDIRTNNSNSSKDAVYNNLDFNTTYYFRGYSKTKKKNIEYSDVKSVTTGCIEIDSIVPRINVKNNSTLIIYGRNFSTINSENTIKVLYDKEYLFTPIESSATKLKFQLVLPNKNPNDNLADVLVDRANDQCNYFQYGIYLGTFSGTLNYANNITINY